MTRPQASVPARRGLATMPLLSGGTALLLALAALAVADTQLRAGEEARALEIATRDIGMLLSQSSPARPLSTSDLQIAVETQRALIEAASAEQAPDRQPRDPCAALGRDPSVIAGLPVRPDPDAGGSMEPFGTALHRPEEVRAAQADLVAGQARIIRFQVSLPPECQAGPQSAIGYARREGDVILVAGRLIDPDGRTRRVLASIGLLMLALSCAATAVAMLVVGRQTRRKLDRLIATLRAASAGDFDARVNGQVGGGAMGILGAEIDRAIERIERLNHGFREIATKTAHDFRTPLTKARLTLDLGLRRGTGHLEAAANKAISQIDDLAAGFAAHLELARALGGEAVKFQMFDLGALASRVAEAHADTALAINRDVDVTVEIEQAPVLAMGLERQVESALGNLLSNAIKASPPGAEVRVVVRRNRAEAWVDVADHGPGWPADLVERLGTFGLRAREDDPDSHGVGLSSVIAVARLHGGRLDRLTVPGGGALARLVLVTG